MKCEEFTILTDCYLRGDMPEKQKEEFELHYFECDSCFAELKLRERLFSKEVRIVLKGKKRFFSFQPILAFSTIFIIVISLAFILKLSGPSSILYDISRFDPPLYIEIESRNSFQQGIFEKAMALYIKKDYKGSLKLLEEIKSSERNPKIHFFMGVNFLINDDLEKALFHLNIIVKNMDPSYYDEAIYYKGIALLRLNKKQEALIQFENLSTMFSPYAAKADIILKKIREM